MRKITHLHSVPLVQDDDINEMARLARGVLRDIREGKIKAFAVVYVSEDGTIHNEFEGDGDPKYQTALIAGLHHVVFRYHAEMGEQERCSEDNEGEPA